MKSVLLVYDLVPIGLYLVFGDILKRIFTVIEYQDGANDSMKRWVRTLT
jgi:hypothetical protein